MKTTAENKTARVTPYASQRVFRQTRYVTTMRTGVILILLAGLVGCSRSPELPEGVSVRVLSGNVIVTLDENVAIQVRQNKQDSRIALVGNHDGTLHVLQLEQSGDPTPRSMTLITRDKAEFSTMTGSGTSRVVILDQDGDGLPDLKIEGGKKFRRANIEWKEIIK